MIYLAPLQGYTEAEYRLAWSSFFTGIDIAVSPFVPLSESLIFRAKHLRDVMPDKNLKMPVIPQVLGNEPGKFIRLSQRLADLGYETVNWNLGCPKPAVARKQRGSGILPFPEKIRSILDKIIPHLPVSLSIKTRLGYQSPGEFYELVTVYNDYPLESLMIHPRIGTQMYEGSLHLGILDQTINSIRRPIVFSGDIVTQADFELISNRYPSISRWMLGRGVLVNPFLPEILLKGTDHLSGEIIRTRQYNFMDELYCEIKDKFQRERTILNKVKDYWSYFSRWYDGDVEIFTHLSRLNTLNEFIPAARHYMMNQPLAPFETRIGRPVGKASEV